MRHKARVAEYLGHIAEAVRRAIGYVEPLPDAEALRQAEQVQDAVIRNLEVIGEAANRIMRADLEFVEAHSDLPWIGMRGMRNKMIHEYFDVDWDVVWRTIRDDLPPLGRQVEALLARLHDR